MTTVWSSGVEGKAVNEATTMQETVIPTEDPYTTVCIHCPEGPTRKPNFLFTPGQLQQYKPKCRACVSEWNARKYARPGVKPGYALRGRST